MIVLFSFEVFTLLQPIYYVTIFATIFNLGYFIIKRESNHKGIVIVNSFFLTLINGLLLFFSGIIVDEMNAVGDSVAFILSVISGVTFLVNLILYFKSKEI